MPKAAPPSTEHRQHLTDEAYRAVLSALKETPDFLDLKPLVDPLHPADVADLLERLPPTQREKVLPFVSQEVLGDVLAEATDGVQENLLEALPNEDVAEALAELESDDVVDIVQHMSDDDAAETRELIKDIHEEKLETYEPETAGGLMQVELLTMPPSTTVAQVIAHMQDQGDDLPENLSTVFVVGPRKRLIGAIGFSRLLRFGPKTKLEKIMRTDPVSVAPDTSQKDVAKLFEKYDLFNVPVVASNGTLLGRITVDDIIDVMLEEHEKETLHMAGVKEGEDLFAPVLTTTQQRLPWLIVNLFTAILASLVIALFEGEIQQLVALAILMPIVASMGGNAGTQTLTVTVRGLATGHITLQNALYLMGKEVMVGGLNGLLLGLVLAVGTWLFYGNMALAGVILAATVLNHLFAALAGHFVPVLLERAGKDPALSSGVLVTTVTDVGGFFVFLGLAAIVLL